MSKIYEPKNIEILRVSPDKLRVKYQIPILFIEGDKTLCLGYQSIGMTLRENSDYSTKHLKVFSCFRPFDKYYNKISGIYSIKKKNLNLEEYLLAQNFEEIDTQFRLPKSLIFKGDGVKEAVRKWKIKKLINNSSKNDELIENNSN
jgi:hypothetical protein